MANVSRHIAKLYAIKIMQGQWKLEDVPAVYRTYTEIYIDQMKRETK